VGSSKCAHGYINVAVVDTAGKAMHPAASAVLVAGDTAGAQAALGGLPTQLLGLRRHYASPSWR
jgi:hypothetical protein